MAFYISNSLTHPRSGAEQEDPLSFETLTLLSSLKILLLEYNFPLEKLAEAEEIVVGV